MLEDDIPSNVMIDDDDDDDEDDDDADNIDLTFARDGGGGSGRGTRPSAAPMSPSAAPMSRSTCAFDECDECDDDGGGDGSGGGGGDSPTAVEEDAADPDGVVSTRVVSAAGSIRFRVWATTNYLSSPPQVIIMESERVIGGEATNICTGS